MATELRLRLKLVTSTTTLNFKVKAEAAGTISVMKGSYMEVANHG